ncbi:hypothetical protein M0R89_19055 (plasmid) [Halorussus limi]|uniref:DUF4350 domain-containing protein n=1 Tax=Halorussus limi TaxID=2938695 RepID=A0A8U0HZS1_9EURY|nr:hypothetical protein [Halorussus limi]UPV76632.1 hypothetical protein M0R89_19055 [Halorussus limi]
MVGLSDDTVSRVVVSVLAIAVVIAFVSATSNSAAAFSLYNPDREETSEFPEQDGTSIIEIQVSRNSPTYRSIPTNGGFTVVLSTHPIVSPPEDADVRKFVRDGATLLVTTDAGCHINNLF